MANQMKGSFNEASQEVLSLIGKRNFSKSWWSEAPSLRPRFQFYPFSNYPRGLPRRLYGYWACIIYSFVEVWSSSALMRNRKLAQNAVAAFPFCHDFFCFLFFLLIVEPTYALTSSSNCPGLELLQGIDGHLPLLQIFSLPIGVIDLICEEESEVIFLVTRRWNGFSNCAGIKRLVINSLKYRKILEIKGGRSPLLLLVFEGWVSAGHQLLQGLPHVDQLGPVGGHPQLLRTHLAQHLSHQEVQVQCRLLHAHQTTWQVQAKLSISQPKVSPFSWKGEIRSRRWNFPGITWLLERYRPFWVQLHVEFCNLGKISQVSFWNKLLWSRALLTRDPGTLSSCQVQIQSFPYPHNCCVASLLGLRTELLLLSDTAKTDTNNSQWQTQNGRKLVSVSKPVKF